MYTKLEWMGYRVAKKAWQYVQPFWYSTRVWQTDRRTDRRTDVQPIAKTCFSIADARKNQSRYIYVCWELTGIARLVTGQTLSVGGKGRVATDLTEQLKKIKTRQHSQRVHTFIKDSVYFAMSKLWHEAIENKKNSAHDQVCCLGICMYWTLMVKSNF